MTRPQTIARNIRLRVAMLLAHAPEWSRTAALEASGLSSTQWSGYTTGARRYCSDAMLERIARGLWLPRGGVLLLSAAENVVGYEVDSHTVNADSTTAR